MVKPKILSDEEIQKVINEGVVKYSGLDVPRRRQAIDSDIAQAQRDKDWKEMLGQFVEWGNSKCPHRKPHSPKHRCFHCWRALSWLEEG